MPLEIGFVSWPMVRYKREVLFGWVDLLGKFDIHLFNIFKTVHNIIIR